MDTANAHNLMSIGRLAQATQRPPAEIVELAERVGVGPTLVLDDVAFFDRNAVKMLIEALRMLEREGVQS